MILIVSFELVEGSQVLCVETIQNAIQNVYKYSLTRLQLN